MKELKDFPKAIKIDEKLELRFSEPTFENAKEQYTCIVKNESHLMPYLEWSHKTKTKTAEDTFRFLEIVAKEWKEQTKFDFAIFYNDIFVGRISFFRVSTQHKSCEFGYWLDKDFVGKGIMSNCIHAIEKLLFNEFGFNRLVIRCNKLNLNSAGVAIRCGFTQEAEFREDRISEIDNVVSSTLVFGKLKSEYKEQR